MVVRDGGLSRAIQRVITSAPPTDNALAFHGLAARGESLAAFDGRCIPGGCVAPPSNTPGILGRRALPAGRLARLGATPDFHHGLLGNQRRKTHEIAEKHET